MSVNKSSEKYCTTCEKNVVPEKRKEKVGWVTGFSVREYYCPDCGLKLSKNVKLGWICCSVLVIISIIVLVLVGPLS